MTTEQSEQDRALIDAVRAILGLEPMTVAQRRLEELRRRRKQQP